MQETRSLIILFFFPREREMCVRAGAGGAERGRERILKQIKPNVGLDLTNPEIANPPKARVWHLTDWDTQLLLVLFLSTKWVFNFFFKQRIVDTQRYNIVIQRSLDIMLCLSCAAAICHRTAPSWLWVFIKELCRVWGTENRTKESTKQSSDSAGFFALNFRVVRSSPLEKPSPFTFVVLKQRSRYNLSQTKIPLFNQKE